jgi:hypothetical protein
MKFSLVNEQRHEAQPGVAMCRIESQSQPGVSFWPKVSTKVSTQPAAATCTPSHGMEGLPPNANTGRTGQIWWCRLQGSNPRPPDYKSGALPTELSRRDVAYIRMGARRGLWRVRATAANTPRFYGAENGRRPACGPAHRAGLQSCEHRVPVNGSDVDDCDDQAERNADPESQHHAEDRPGEQPGREQANSHEQRCVVKRDCGTFPWLRHAQGILDGGCFTLIPVRLQGAFECEQLAPTGRYRLARHDARMLLQAAYELLLVIMRENVFPQPQ